MSGPPAYGATLLPRLADGHAPGREELHLHLGYFDDPAPADPEAGMRAAQRRLDALVLEVAAVAPGMAVLDVGCGLGATLAALDDRGRDLALLGVNVDAAQLAVARSVLRPRPGTTLAFVRADACALPLPAGRFDRVLAVECAFHFPSRRRFLAEAARVLAPGGRVVLTDFVVPAGDPGPLATKGDRACARVLDEVLGPWPDPAFREGPWPALARVVGLVPVVERDLTAHVLPSYGVLQGPGSPKGLHPGVACLERLQRHGRLALALHAFEAAA